MKPYSGISPQMYSGHIIPTDRQMFGNPQFVTYSFLRTMPIIKWNSWERFRQMDELEPPSSAAPDTNITALSRKLSRNAEVWWIGKNGSVQGGSLDDRGHWNRYVVAPANSATPSANA